MQLTSVSKNQTLFTQESNPLAINEHWFNPQYWLEQDKVFAQKTGRATAYFFAEKELKAVLRHYWRGGLVGKVLQDQYLFTGMDNTRVYKEFALMCELHQQGLPVVEPIAALVTRSGLIYRGDIITRALEGATSLCERLVAGPLAAQLITHIGETIARFHKAGVYHADLNINNVLFDDQDKVHVIDFDRGELRPPQTQWQQQNMQRLQRSFTKEAGRQPSFHWQQSDWQKLEEAYQRALSC
ncbi:3-deoxy-D-manno-octulosonic acid kinase [Pseudoalteromonas sp. YIC-656]|uniref:3-deoxy-D-manno-octulosonic acid kinase n=1 Tax=Pseudoalteromonas pernae TaxID=3118054 RepID=UPI0032421CA1